MVSLSFYCTNYSHMIMMFKTVIRLPGRNSSFGPRTQKDSGAKKQASVPSCGQEEGASRGQYILSFQNIHISNY